MVLLTLAEGRPLFDTATMVEPRNSGGAGAGKVKGSTTVPDQHSKWSMKIR